ncbi:MAG: alpha/beta hydrolase [Moraxellaceae bacterium]
MSSSASLQQVKSGEAEAAAPDIDALQRALLRLDLSVFSPLQGVVADYVRYYGIDLENVVPDVRHYTGWFEAYGYRLLGHVFLPAEARGTVFFLHGYLDHSGLYRHLMRDCLERGHAVFILDLPGHGLSSGDRVDIPDFSHYQYVLSDAIERYGSELPSPFYAVGLSMGGAIVMDYVLSASAQGRPAPFRKILLLAPLVRPAQWAQIRFGWWLVRHFRPAVPRVFRNNSSDEEYLHFVRERDPLQARQVPMRWIGALRRWVGYMGRLPPCPTPALLVQGGRDETVEWTYNNEFVRQHFPLEYEALIPDASHQLPNERDDLRAQVHEALAHMLAT